MGFEGQLIIYIYALKNLQKLTVSMISELRDIELWLLRIALFEKKYLSWF